MVAISPTNILDKETAENETNSIAYMLPSTKGSESNIPSLTQVY
jgi:hypothetical protein